MKISTRIAAGLGLLLALVVTTAAYQLSVIQKLEGVSRELSGIRLEASRAAVALLQEGEIIREFAAKALLLGDPDYAAEWIRAEERLDKGLERLVELRLVGAEAQDRVDIMEARSEWGEIMAPFLPDPGTPGPTPVSAEALDALDRADPALLALRSATERLLADNDARVTQEAALAAGAAARARWIAWVATGLSVAGAMLLGGILWVSISGPLRRLTEGTRELARGRFEHRIEDRSRSEFGTLARDFNLMAERLDELEELKRDFVSHVSHELKGPLAAVQETILVLLEEIPGPLTDRQRYLLELSQGSASRLSRMISDLLEISRLEADATLYNPTPVHLADIVRRHLAEVEPLVEERRLSVTLEDRTNGGTLGGRALADGDRLHDVVANLVGNAVKFSPTQGTIHICVEDRGDVPPGLPPRYRALDERESAPFLLFAVEDEGPGIPEEHREGIFEKFHQVSLNGRKQGQGVGLGLAISRRIVEAHGGAVWAEEGQDGGARLQVLLPVYPSRWPELAGSLEAGSRDESAPLPVPAADPSRTDGSTTVHA